MVKSLLDGIDLITDLINSGSLVDPLTSRSGNFAFSDDLRLSGQFPKIYVTGEMSSADTDYTFSEHPEYMSEASVIIYFYTKLSRENIFTDSEGSYKNERLVFHYQKLIKNMIMDNLKEFKNIGFSNIRIIGAPEVIPNRDLGLFAGHVKITFIWRNFN